MRFKVGDRVRIKSFDWYKENKDENGSVLCNYNYYFTRLMTKYCGEVMTVKDIINVPICRCYMFEEDEFVCHFSDDMLEGLVEETKSEPKFKVGDSVEVLKSGNTYTISQVKFNGKEFVYTLSNNGSTVSCFSENELKPIHFIDIAIKPHNVRGDEIIKMLEELGGINAFSFDGSDHNCVSPFAYYVNDDKQIYVGGTGFLRKNGYKIHDLEELKKKEYPKAYEECCYVLGFENTELVFEDDYRDINPPKEQWKRLGLINQFNKLLICRDAYWKLYGEEMGLGKDLSWVPDWMCIDSLYAILYRYHYICKAEVNGGTSCILAFPTAEIRDAFYENFKELIESCKELL